MAVNLVSIVTQFLSPDLVARIASALGLDLSAAQKAIGGSVPAILAGLVGVALKPEGARQLSSVLAQQSPNILDNLTSVIGGSAQKTFAESGSNLLSTLLGGGATNALATSISKFAGISGSASSSPSECSARWFSACWAKSSGAQVLMPGDWRPCFNRKRTRLPLRFLPAWPIAWAAAVC
jgi:Bacterial protein of unknown function (DUF937)